MGQFTVFVFLLAASISSYAQIEFSSAITEGMLQQNQAAQEIHQSTGTRIVAAAEIAPDSASVQTEQVVHRSANEKQGKDEKDFTVQLRPTGHGPAQRWFQVAYQVDQKKKAQERAEKRLALKAKKEKIRQARLARAQQKLNSKKSRGMASVKSTRKVKGKSQRTVQAAQNNKAARK